MTTFDERHRLLEHLESKEFRDALVESDIANGILFQLNAMSADRGWTQEELAEEAGTAQPVISKYLKGYENFSVKTLRKLASAFDVSLTIRFERFSELANRHLNMDWAGLAIPDHANDAALRGPVFEYSLAASDIHSPIISGTTRITVEQLDLDVAFRVPESDESWLMEAKTPQQKEERTNYAHAA